MRCVLPGRCDGRRQYHILYIHTHTHTYNTRAHIILYGLYPIHFIVILILYIPILFSLLLFSKNSVRPCQRIIVHRVSAVHNTMSRYTHTRELRARINVGAQKEIFLHTTCFYIVVAYFIIY